MTIIYGLDLRFETDNHKYVCAHPGCANTKANLYAKGRYACEIHTWNMLFTRESYPIFGADVWLANNQDVWLYGNALVHMLPPDWDGDPRDIDAVEEATLMATPLISRVIVKDDGVLFFDAADTEFKVAGVIHTDACVIAIDRRPVAYNYLGGTFACVSGIFTVLWNGRGILTAWEPA